jgi:tetratricopeptide (TPR) repeat protein
MQAILLLVLVGGAGAGGYYAFHTRMETLRHRRVNEAWGRFNAAIRNNDEEAMQAALADVKAADPADVRAATWGHVLETGEGDPGDPATVYVSLIRNLRTGKPEDAAREAQKRLEHEPKDWLARCVLASAALARKDRDEANRELDQLPPPDDRRANVTPSGLLMAFKLYRVLGRDAAPLRAFAQSYVLPFLRTATAKGFSPVQKADLIETYLESFDPTDTRQPVGVQQGWTPAARLANQALDDALEAGDAVALARIGRIGSPMARALRVLQHHKQVDAQQFADLNKELEDRTRRAWEALKAKDPKNPEPYRGLAELHWRAGTPDSRRAAWDTVAEGLQTAGGDPQLYEVFSQILKQVGAPHAAWAELSRAAESAPDKPVLWVLAADAALAAGRRDLTLAACQKIREKDPESRWATWTEARSWLASGFPQKALDQLTKLGEPALAAEPAAARAYTRALTETGQEARVEGFLALAEKANTPHPAAAALAGWAEALPVDPARSRKVAARTERLLSRWPDDANLFRVRADALFRAAEEGDPPWEPTRVREAVLAAERLRAKLPADPQAATELGWLRLAENNPDRARYDTAPLRTPDAAPTLSLRQQELLGAIDRQTGKLDDAVRTLERAAGDPSAPAGVLVQLALAYHARGQLDAARSTLSRARNLPRTPREQANYVAAVGVLQN